ncbi:MAG: hypothetical protein Q9215_005591 [Flavoplaca cf. flavocitrina]
MTSQDESLGVDRRECSGDEEVELIGLLSDAEVENGKDKDVRFDQTGSNCYVPSRDGLVVEQDSKVIIPCPEADILSLVRSFRRSLLKVATFAWSEHQSGRGDPKKEDEDFGGKAGNGIGGAAAGKWV